MGVSTPGQITEFLQRWSQGDEQALDVVIHLVYDDLRRLASYQLRGERPGRTLQPTALVNEAYLKLAGKAKLQWQSRAHFFAVASRAMRQILVDHARRRRRVKRGQGATPLPLNEELIFVPERSEALLALDEALRGLAEARPRPAKVVEMRFFGGMSNEEIGEVLQISPNTVMRDWNFAKAWLHRALSQ